MQIAQNKQPTKQAKGKTLRTRGKEEPPGQWPPRTVVAATATLWWLPPAVVALPLPGYFGFVRYFGFHAMPVRLLLVFCFKMENVSGFREGVSS